MFWESLLTFFSGVWKIFVHLFQMQESDSFFPLNFLLFWHHLVRSQGQHEGQSNPLYLLQLWKLKVVGNVLVLSAAKNHSMYCPPSYLLKEKDEYVSPWIWVLGAKWAGTMTSPLLVNVSLSFLGWIKQDCKVHCFNFCKVSRAVGNQEVPAPPGDMMLSWICPT